LADGPRSTSVAVNKAPGSLPEFLHRFVKEEQILFGAAR
jgi:hypothetical protein